MKSPSRIKIGIIVILLITFFVVLNLTGFSKEVKNFFYFISSPVQRTLWQAGDRVSDFFQTISEIKNLKKENEELKLRVEELSAEKVFLKELKKENEILREALEIGLEKEFKLVFAKVIGKDISQDSILIDKGTKDDILEGLPVVTQQKTLVGKISEVYENFSKVMLISNKNSSFDAKVSEVEEGKPSSPPFAIARETEIYGVVKGRGNFRSYFDLVPHDQELKEGDLLITTSLGGIFPAGILVGEIKKVGKFDLKPFQQAEISQPFDTKELETVFIIFPR